MRIRRFVHLILLLGAGGLAWQVFVVWSHTAPPLVTDAALNSDTTLPSFSPAGPQAGQELVQVITDKNLFAPSRRPPPTQPPSQPSAPAVPPPKHLKLVGVFILGERREALFADTSKGGKVTRVGSGGTLDSYQLARLTHTEATLALGAGGQEFSLPLDVQKSADAAKAPRIIPARPRLNPEASAEAPPLPTGAQPSGTAVPIPGEPPPPPQTAAASSSQDDIVTIRRNIRRMQRRLREIRRARALERREARDG